MFQLEASSSSVGIPAWPSQLHIDIAGGQGQGLGLQDRTGAKYLLAKVLKPSDVGSLSRIVLHNRDAETHLPSLARREGIPFDCEDYITGETMALRYRFWPISKSRMYVLENTADFIERHQLREADSIAIYRNEVDGKYLIRPRKDEDRQEPRPREG